MMPINSPDYTIDLSGFNQYRDVSHYLRSKRRKRFMLRGVVGALFLGAVYGAVILAARGT